MLVWFEERNRYTVFKTLNLDTRIIHSFRNNLAFTSLYILEHYPHFMAGVDSEFKAAYDTIHNEVTEISKNASIKDWGTGFEKWCIPKLSQWFQIPEQDVYWVGRLGNERMLDIGMIDRTHGLIYIFQCKSSENQDHSKATVQSYKLVNEPNEALKWLKTTPLDGQTDRKKFAIDVAEFLNCDLDDLKDQSDDNFRLLFVTNSVVSENKQVKQMVKAGLEIWDIEKLSNNCFKKKRELSNLIDFYHLSNPKEGEKITSMFGYVKAQDLVNFSRIKSSSNQIDDTLFEDNLRHQLHTKQAKAIRNDILKSLLNSPKDFPSLNNGLLIVGSKTKKYSQGWVSNPNGTLAWDGTNKPNDLSRLVAKATPSKEEEKEIKNLKSELKLIQDEITSMQISHAGIINGGQTTTALYDHIVKNTIPIDAKGEPIYLSKDDSQAAKDAFVFCKICFIEEGDEFSRQNLAIASNRQNPIEAIDYLSYRTEHLKISQELNSLDHAILYMYKRGLDNLAKEDEHWKNRVSSNLDARYMRKIPIDTYGLNLLATREGKPGKAREGAETANILVVGSENYEAVFSAPSRFDIKIVIFGEFLRRITELQRRTRNNLVKIQKEKDMKMVVAESDEDEKDKLRQTHSNRIAQNIGFTNYWTYSLMYLFHKIFTQIANNYFSKKKDTIFEDCKDKTECIELLYNLAIHNEDTNFLESMDIMSLCFHHNANKTHFSDDTRPDSKNKIRVHFEKGDLLVLLNGKSDTHPILFKTIYTIYDALRTKYNVTQAGNYFNAKKNIDHIWSTSLEPKCNEDGAILSTFGIQVSTKATTPAVAAVAAVAAVRPYDELLKLCEGFEETDKFEEFVEELVEEELHIRIVLKILSKKKLKRVRNILVEKKVKNVPKQNDFLPSLLEEIAKEVDKLGIEGDTGVAPKPATESIPLPEEKTGSTGNGIKPVDEDLKEIKVVDNVDPNLDDPDVKLV